jgi:mannose-6-phosphate isomerase-like protein (cupin superfamily)
MFGWIILFVILVLIIIYIKRRDYQVWSINIEQSTKNNNNWRDVLYTSKNLQVVNMSIPKGDEITLEVHPKTDQFFRIEDGTGLLQTKFKNKITNMKLNDGVAAVVPQGHQHVLKNTGDKPLKLYTIYSPPHHKPNLVQLSKS